MPKGRAVPPVAPIAYERAPGLNACDCDSCVRIDSILQREQARLETRATTGYQKAGRGVVEVHLCKDCGKHLSDAGTRDGIEYTPHKELYSWDAKNGAVIANYDPTAEYIVMILDHFTDQMTTRQIPYSPAAPTA